MILTKTKNKMNNGKGRNNLFCSFLAIVSILLICMLGSYLLTTWKVKEQIRQNTVTSNEKILSQIEAKTSEFHNSLYNILTLLAYERTVYHYFEQSPRERLSEYEALVDLLSNTLMIQDDIAGIALHDRDSRRLMGVGKDLDLYAKISEVSQVTYSNVFRPNSSSEVYYMVFYPVYDLLNGNYDKKLGMIVFLMRAGKFSTYLENTEITEHEQLFLLDQKNVVIAGNRGQAFRRLDGVLSGNTEDFLIQTAEQKETGWKIVSMIPRAELDSGMTFVRGAILICFLITLLGLALLLYFSYALIIRRIRRMDAFVIDNIARSSERLAVDRPDEIGILAGNLNHLLDEKDEMSEKLRHSQQILYETELAKQQLQVLAYRSQINPHFLYNTFECIRAMALYYDAEEIAEITMALSKIFRYSIKGENVVTVEKELNNIREYAKIIRYRFGERIRVEIEAQAGVLKKQMIKLILQPVVENSIFHGLEQKLEDGVVRVRVSCPGNRRLEFTVEDDGCGMEEEAVKRLLDRVRSQRISAGSAKDSIGLANIYQRLKLYYGEEAQFSMESSPGKGMKVRIRIPDRPRREEAVPHVQDHSGG